LAGLQRPQSGGNLIFQGLVNIISLKKSNFKFGTHTWSICCILDSGTTVTTLYPCITMEHTVWSTNTYIFCIIFYYIEHIQ
jgi:hypothetical protein